MAQGLADQRLLVRAELTAAKYPQPRSSAAQRTGHAADRRREFGPGVVEGVLIDALTRGQTWAATAAVEVLGDVGTEALLDTAGAVAVPLGRGRPQRRPPAALRGDRRHFADRSHRAVCRRQLGRRRLDVFCRHQRLSQGVGRPSAVGARQELASLLAEQGYVADMVTNSRQFMELANRSPDYELALVDVSLGSPPVDDLIGRLRRDPRTADLPIGVMVGDEMREPVERLAKGWPWVVAIGRMADEHSLRFELSRILASVGRDQLGHEARQAQAAAALARLAELADHHNPVFNVERVTPAVVRAAARAGFDRRRGVGSVRPARPARRSTPCWTWPTTACCRPRFARSGPSASPATCGSSACI